MIVDTLIGFLNFLIESLAFIANALVYILPTSPFVQKFNIPYLDGLAWIIDFNFIISITTTWLTCVALYYSLSTILRWVKVVS